MRTVWSCHENRVELQDSGRDSDRTEMIPNGPKHSLVLHCKPTIIVILVVPYISTQNFKQCFFKLGGKQASLLALNNT